MALLQPISESSLNNAQVDVAPVVITGYCFFFQRLSNSSLEVIVLEAVTMNAATVLTAHEMGSLVTCVKCVCVCDSIE